MGVILTFLVQKEEGNILDWLGRGNFQFALSNLNLGWGRLGIWGGKPFLGGKGLT